MDRAPILTRGEVIDRARAAQKAALAAAVEELEMALAWAALHPCPIDEVPAHWGEVDLHGEGLVALAGPGAPQVAEFAPLELAAALAITHDAARQLVADALELGHRLPRLWDRVRTGQVPAWRARLISRETVDLCVDAALFADRLIAATPTKVGLVNAARLVQEARLYFDPYRATADEEQALARRGVWLRHGAAPATTEVTMTLDTPDAEQFHQSVCRIAADLRDLGDADPLEVRRARAVGILADPQYALDLMSGRADAGPTARPISGPMSGRGGAVNLFVHLTPHDLTGTGAVTIERLGAATTRLLGDWLRRHTARGARVVVRPVLDLAATNAVDQHDPPAAMRELVIAREAHCVFPGCRRDSRACDIDHIDAYRAPTEGGPPGQTNPENLAPLCRTHHRAKTHTEWTYQRRRDGTISWTSPTGHTYPVTPTSRAPATPVCLTG